MANLDDLTLNDEPIEISHPFESELALFVSTNHKLALEGIARLEDADIARVREDTLTQDHETRRDEERYVEMYYQELKNTANNLALVGLVTRLHHWMSKFVKELTGTNAAEQSLNKNLAILNDRLGIGPVPATFFGDLVTVRDSIIHADSKAQWMYANKLRRVPERYSHSLFGEVDFSDWQLEEAIQNSTKQVIWYEEKLLAVQTQSKKGNTP